MKLVDLSITEFAKVLGSDAPAPGGGSAAALSAANGISLTKMVCELTIGKKKYAEFEDHIKGVNEKSAQLQDQLLEAIDIFQKKRKKRKPLVAKPCKKL